MKPKHSILMTHLISWQLNFELELFGQINQSYNLNTSYVKKSSDGQFEEISLNFNDNQTLISKLYLVASALFTCGCCVMQQANHWPHTSPAIVDEQIGIGGGLLEWREATQSVGTKTDRWLGRTGGFRDPSRRWSQLSFMFCQGIWLSLGLGII